MAVFFHKLAAEGALLLLIVQLELLTRRFFCRSFCPLGGLLALVGSRRRLQVRLNEQHCICCGRCAAACPMGLHPELGETGSAYCWNCGECADSCQQQALSFRWRQR